jgi:hypothetical protein
MSMKNSSDAIWNQARNLPACSLRLQPKAPPRAPGFQFIELLNAQKSLWRTEAGRKKRMFRTMHRGQH